jgi:signal transduction histidine kinase
VIIRVDNNGPGIPADQKKNIFRPAITADPAAHFGLGLSFVQSVAQRHGGYAEECGNVAKGASFRVIFPQ